MNIRKGISPVLATVIIIAVTLVIAIGVIGWIMGIWRGFGTTETPQILPDSKLYDNKTMVLHVKNSGTASSVITRVEIVGTGCYATPSNPSGWTIGPGETKYITDTGASDSIGLLTLSGTCALTAGGRYQVQIFTEAGNTASAILVVENS